MNKVIQLCMVSFVLLSPICLLAQITIETVGTTQYIYQSNGPTGNRIVLDNLGGVHFAWTNGHPYPTTRSAYFNCLTRTGWIWPDVGGEVSFRNGAGYGQIDILNDNRAIIAYHHAPTNAETVYVAIDAFNCLGQFEYHRAPNRFSGNACIWPYLTVDNVNNVHLVTTQTADPGSPKRFIYTRSINHGTTWTSAQIVDTTSGAAIIVSSNASDKVVIVYAKRRDGDDRKNNIFYIQSPDGLTWDFSNGRVGVTSYPTDDSIYANYDFDAIYDSNDNLHIAWVAQSYLHGNNTGPVYLYHYDTQSGSISEVAQYEMPEICAFPLDYLAIAMPSLSADDNGNLFVSYSRFDTSDCSRAGEANGELFAQYSTDNGTTWSNPLNISNTPSPDCQPPACMSEVWPSLAEEVGDYLHLTCVVDIGGGEIGYDSPVVYYKIPVEVMAIADNDTRLPGYLNLSSYPNPFNASTTISFALGQAGQVTLEIYDLLGRKMATLIEGPMQAGEHKLVWDAGMHSSGIYFMALKADNQVETRRLTLLK